MPLRTTVTAAVDAAGKPVPVSVTRSPPRDEPFEGEMSVTVGVAASEYATERAELLAKAGAGSEPPRRKAASSVGATGVTFTEGTHAPEACAATGMPLKAISRA